jgi:hypothetical protein
MMIWDKNWDGNYMQYIQSNFENNWTLRTSAMRFWSGNIDEYFATCFLEPVYTVPDSRSHDNDLYEFKVVVHSYHCMKFRFCNTLDLRARLVLKLLNLMSCMTKWIWYRVNRVLALLEKCIAKK